MGIYSLMNRDREIVRFECVNNIMVEYRVLDNNLFNIVNTFQMERWISNRINPVERKQVKILLGAGGILNVEQYIKATNAISLNDSMWIKEYNKNLCWADVNPYNKKIDKGLQEFLGGDYKNKVNIGYKSLKSPELTTGGSYDKLWISKYSSIRMIKFGRENLEGYSAEEPYSEYYTYQIARQLEIDNIIEYHIVEFKGKIATECKLFTDEELGYIGICNTKYAGLDIEQQMRIYYNLGYLNEFREMLLLDSLSYNTDRHGNNYGFSINNRTLEIVGMNPIFDNNLALFPGLNLRLPQQVLLNEIIYSYPKTLADTFTAQGKLVLTDNLRARLKNMYPFKIEARDSIGRDLRREKLIEYIVNRQIKLILA